MQVDVSESWRKKDFPVLTAVLCGWCAIVFLAISFEKDPSWSAVRGWGYVSDRDIYKGDYWGLITSAYVHVEPIHLIFNLYWLWIIGGAFERALGPVRLLAFVAAAAFVSSGCQLLSGQSGIGMSGVGYALVGFGWIARAKYPELRIVNQRVLLLFLAWGLFCIVATYARLLNIANLAHAAGLAFGVVLGALACIPRLRFPSVAGLALLSALAVLPLFWNPRSVDWVLFKAEKAYKSGDLVTAARFFERSIDMGSDPKLGWPVVARIYGILKDNQRYRRAIERLRSIDPEAADEIVKDYGPPK